SADFDSPPGATRTASQTLVCHRWSTRSVNRYPHLFFAALVAFLTGPDRESVRARRSHTMGAGGRARPIDPRGGPGVGLRPATSPGGGFGSAPQPLARSLRHRGPTHHGRSDRGAQVVVTCEVRPWDWTNWGPLLWYVERIGLTTPKGRESSSRA